MVDDSCVALTTLISNFQRGDIFEKFQDFGRNKKGGVMPRL